MRALLWSLEWATSRSKGGRLIRSTIEPLLPETICLTESSADMQPDDGHAITSGSDYGYAQPGHRSKVLLWSRAPWDAVDSQGSGELPVGRFVSGVTQGIRFVGVCIPWREAHVRTGRRDREAWQDHLTYLSHLRPLPRRYTADELPVCVLGD